MIPFPNRKYNIIYADPAWSFNFSSRKGLSRNAKKRLYTTMQDQEILELPISEIADENCILFLWVLNSKLPLSLNCIEISYTN